MNRHADRPGARLRRRHSTERRIGRGRTRRSLQHWRPTRAVLARRSATSMATSWRPTAGRCAHVGRRASADAGLRSAAARRARSCPPAARPSPPRAPTPPLPRVRRDRRGRGLRTPLLPVTVPAARTRAEQFDQAVLEAVADLEERWPGRLEAIEFAVDEVPGVPPRRAGGGRPTTSCWTPACRWPGSCRPASTSRGRPTKARIVVYRRPLEVRSTDAARPGRPGQRGAGGAGQRDPGRAGRRPAGSRLRPARPDGAAACDQLTVRSAYRSSSGDDLPCPAAPGKSGSA